MRTFVGLLAVGLMAIPALAQPYNARGTFNDWGETPMNDDGDGTYSVTIGGLTQGDWEDFKVAFNDWAESWPPQNARAAIGESGDLTIHFIPGMIGDGWQPEADRVGYDDTGEIAWELSGGFNDWAVNDPLAAMTDNGGGLYSVDYTIATPNTYEFKFKAQTTWDISIGADFGNFDTPNAEFTTTVPNEVLTFELDLPNGRWRVIPEPTSLALLGLAAVALLRRRY
jgi:hypothetical protein